MKELIENMFKMLDDHEKLLEYYKCYTYRKINVDIDNALYRLCNEASYNFTQTLRSKLERMQELETGINESCKEN